MIPQPAFFGPSPIPTAGFPRKVHDRAAAHGIQSSGPAMAQYLHKVKDGRNVYFIANSTDRRVDTAVTVRGRLTLQRWNPHTGEAAGLDTTNAVENGQPFTQARLQLDPVKSVCLVETRRRSQPIPPSFPDARFY